MAKADPQRPFVHLDVQTAYSTGGTSPSLPEDYVRALARQHPLDARTSDAERVYLAIADYVLHSVVKTAVACARAGIEHIAALRVRVVPESTAWNYQREHSSRKSGAMRDVMTMAMGSPGVYRRI